MRFLRLLVVLGTMLAAAWAGLARATYPGRDGPVIAFVRAIPPCPSGHCKTVIATVRPDGSGERHLTSGILDANPAWSPDGTRIAFIHGFPVSPAPQVEVMSATGAARKLLVRKSRYLHGGYEGFPRLDWLDNRQIVFENHGEAVGATITHPHGQIFAFDSEAALAACRVPLLNLRASPLADMARLRQLRPEVVTGQTVGSGHFIQLEGPGQGNAMLARVLETSVRPAGTAV